MFWNSPGSARQPVGCTCYCIAVYSVLSARFFRRSFSPVVLYPTRLRQYTRDGQRLFRYLPEPFLRDSQLQNPYMMRAE